MDKSKTEGRACGPVWGIKYKVKSPLAELSPGQRARLFGERRGRVPVRGEVELETFPDGRQCLVARLDDGEGTTVCLDFDPGALAPEPALAPRDEAPTAAAAAKPAPREGDQSSCCGHFARPAWRRSRGKSGWCVEVPGLGDPGLSPAVACPYCGTRLSPGRVDKEGRVA